jgi:hypothetical protein
MMAMENKPNLEALIQERVADATPKPATPLENVALTLKLLLGAMILALLFWYFDSQIIQ